MSKMVAETECESDLSTYELVFEAVTCDTCGQTYPVTRACDCGEWTPRPDQHAADRQAAIADLLPLLDAPVVPTTPIDFVEVIDALSPWIPNLFVGLNVLGSDSADASGVRSQIQLLLELRARVAANGRRRPWLALWDPVAALIDALLAMARTFLDATAAADPETAQELEAVGQAHLDEAARQIGIVNLRLDWWGLERTIRLPDSAVAAAAAAYEATGAHNLIDLDQHGMALYERITGKPSGPTGVGVGLLIDLGLVDRALDEARVYEVAKLGYRRIDGNRAAFRSLLDDPGWRADLLQARRVFYEAQLEAETLVRELAGDRRIEAKAVIELGFTMTESVSKTLLGLVLAVEGSSAPKRTEQYDTVLAAAKAGGLREATLGFDERIRNAHAHVDIDVESDHVILGRNYARPHKLSDDELVDTVLASLESCAALFGAIDCVINEEGHDAGTDRLLDLPSADLLSILLAASGVHPGTITFGTDRLEISGAAHGNLGINPLTVIAIVTPHVPSDVKRLVLRLKRRAGTVVAVVALEPLRRFQGGEGLAKQAGFVEFLGRATINGRVVFSPRHVRFMMARFVYDLRDGSLPEIETAGRTLVATARRLKDRDLADALDAFVLVLRAREDGLGVSERTRQTFQRIATYIGTPPGPWNDGSGTGGRLAAA